MKRPIEELFIEEYYARTGFRETTEIRTDFGGLCHMLRCFKEEITAVNNDYRIANISESEFKKLIKIMYPKDNSKKFRP